MDILAHVHSLLWICELLSFKQILKEESLLTDRYIPKHGLTFIGLNSVI